MSTAPAKTEIETSWSPPVVLSAVTVERGTLHVAREDLLPGGTKQRAITPFLREKIARGKTEAVYASPFCGFAQVALAASALPLGIGVQLFCEGDPGSGFTSPHAYSRLAEKFGARVTLAKDLAEAELLAARYSAASPARLKIPLGFHDPLYRRELEIALTRELAHVRTTLGRFPARIWLPVGSGTLTRVFVALVPRECELICVDVGVLAERDPRMKWIRESDRIRYIRAAEPFQEPAAERPPLPSNVHYDAKLWSFLRREALDGDLWWNVGP